MYTGRKTIHLKEETMKAAVGVQLNAIKPGSIFEQIGIQNGDVITEFNGIEVTNQQESAAVLRELTQAKRFDVVVDRGGSNVELSYEID